MKKFSELEDLYPRPTGYNGQQDGIPQGDDIPVDLTDETVVEAYKYPWKAYGNLKDATDDVTDSVWGIQDGRRDIRQMASIPEMKKGKDNA